MRSPRSQEPQTWIPILLTCGVAIGCAGWQQAAPPAPGPVATLDGLDVRQIPTGERFPWQPKELVAVIGTHRWRSWSPAVAVAVSPGGTTIASGGMDPCIRLWDTNGRETAALEHEGRTVNALAFSPDGRMLLAGADYGDRVTILAWDLRASPPSPLPPVEPSREPRPRFGIPQLPAMDALAFTRDGRLLAGTIGRQTGVRIVLWDATTWPPRELPALPETSGPFAFSADGKTLVTQHGQGGILVWDLTGERPRKKAAGTLQRPRN
jgi:hypothetical protein